MTAAELLRDLVEALPKTEFWTPKLHAAEKAARRHLASEEGTKSGDWIIHQVETWCGPPAKLKKKRAVKR